MTASTKKVLLDTSSCLHPNASEVLSQVMIPAAKRGEYTVIVAGRVLEELAKHAKGDKPGLQKRATAMIKLLQEAAQGGAVIFVGDPDDAFADAVLQNAVSRLRMKYPLAVLTQDVPLMCDVLELADSRSIGRGLHTVEAWTIDEDRGLLRQVAQQEASQRYEAQQKRRLISLAVTGTSAFVPYQETAKLRNADDRTIGTSVTVEHGSELTDAAGQTVYLGPRIGSGGEGSVHETSDQDVVAKIYRPKFLTTQREAKLARMVEHGLDFDNPMTDSICWPTSLLRDSQGVFRGYLMKRGRGQVLANSVFIGTELTRSFPQWDRIDLVDLCITIVERIHFLHEANVLIGDINPNNILVAASDEVYFLDTDSYQLEGWPCPVGTGHFTAPEIQQQSFGDFLRTKENERFAVATLLFMILHAGKQPYAQVGADDYLENVRNRRFPYPFETRGSRNAPQGPWRFIWSNLTYKMKEAFFCSFDASMTDERRIRVRRWAELLDSYKHHLEAHCAPGHVERALLPDHNKPLSQHAIATYKTDKPSLPASGMCH